MELKSRVRTVSVIFVVLLLTPLINLVRYQFIEADDILSRPNELRLEQKQELRGSLLDRRRDVLAYSKGQQRVYPLGEAIGSLLGGYSGDSGLDNMLAAETKPMDVPRGPVDAVRLIRKYDMRGNDVVLTIDSRLQRGIYELLSGYLGAAVLMDTRTGELLALVSRPSFDSNRVREEAYWKSLIEQTETAPLVERCLSGRYPPGSTFKTVVMSGALEEGLARPDEMFDCKGSMYVGSFLLNCNATHGQISLCEALAYSCNVAFAELGTRLGVEGIDRWASRFGMMDDFACVPGSGKAQLASDSAWSASAEAAIGQADLLVSPLHMAVVASVIANRGRLVEPRLVKGTASSDGQWVSQTECREAAEVMSAGTAETVAEAMRLAVSSGTCVNAALPDVLVSGKSGSAENPRGDTHAWFIGYAPSDSPRFACAVVLENAGGGGRYAAPIAGKIFRMAFDLDE
ncbi:hypothetical protein IJT17_02645 [bacterium]|nr:hypothetical protein [bacterium]